MANAYFLKILPLSSPQQYQRKEQPQIGKGRPRHLAATATREGDLYVVVLRHVAEGVGRGGPHRRAVNGYLQQGVSLVCSDGEGLVRAVTDFHFPRWGYGADLPRI